MIGRADDDGVDIFARQDFFVIARGEDVVAPEFLAVLEASVVTIGHGNELHAGNLERGTGVSLALPTGADQGDLDVIVGRSGSGRLVLR